MSVRFPATAQAPTPRTSSRARARARARASLLLLQGSVARHAVAALKPEQRVKSGSMMQIPIALASQISYTPPITPRSSKSQTQTPRSGVPANFVHPVTSYSALQKEYVRTMKTSAPMSRTSPYRPGSVRFSQAMTAPPGVPQLALDALEARSTARPSIPQAAHPLLQTSASTPAICEASSPKLGRGSSNRTFSPLPDPTVDPSAENPAFPIAPVCQFWSPDGAGPDEVDEDRLGGADPASREVDEVDLGLHRAGPDAVDLLQQSQQAEGESFFGEKERLAAERASQVQQDCITALTANIFRSHEACQVAEQPASRMQLPTSLATGSKDHWLTTIAQAAELQQRLQQMPAGSVSARERLVLLTDQKKRLAATRRLLKKREGLAGSLNLGDKAAAMLEQMLEANAKAEDEEWLADQECWEQHQTSLNVAGGLARRSRSEPSLVGLQSSKECLAEDAAAEANAEAEEGEWLADQTCWEQHQTILKVAGALARRSRSEPSLVDLQSSKECLAEDAAAEEKRRVAAEVELAEMHCFAARFAAAEEKRLVWHTSEEAAEKKTGTAPKKLAHLGHASEAEATALAKKERAAAAAAANQADEADVAAGQEEPVEMESLVAQAPYYHRLKAAKNEKGRVAAEGHEAAAETGIDNDREASGLKWDFETAWHRDRVKAAKVEKRPLAAEGHVAAEAAIDNDREASGLNWVFEKACHRDRVKAAKVEKRRLAAEGHVAAEAAIDSDREAAAKGEREVSEQVPDFRRLVSEVAEKEAAAKAARRARRSRSKEAAAKKEREAAEAPAKAEKAERERLTAETAAKIVCEAVAIVERQCLAAKKFESWMCMYM